MCGIAAIYAYKPGSPLVNREQLSRICQRMSCRGPDGAGAWFTDDERVALGHRRLAIIDLSARGAQPMTSSDGSLTITFNGEIYNYRELRSWLETRGRQFTSNSDTEVLLHMYAEKGEQMVSDLRGMFAFAIWDSRRRGLFMARDHFGIKPLYYADDGRSFRIASEVKGLLAGGSIDTGMDPAGHVGFFLWGHIPEPFTLYRGIRSLPAGSSLWVDEDGPRSPRTFAKFKDIVSSSTEAGRETLAHLRDAVVESVRYHLVADVDVGLFLSSGVDSLTLACLATLAGGRLRTVTLGFEEFRNTANDETVLAEDVARRLGADHHTVWVTEEEFRRELETILDRMDQPSIDGINMYFVAKAAREAGLKVAISGLGGDELFGGYPSFAQVPSLVSRARRIPASPAIGRMLRRITAPLVNRVASPKYAGLLEYGHTFAGAYLLRRALYMPWELQSLLDPEFVAQGWRDLSVLAELEATTEGLTTDRLKVSALEGSWYMRNQLLRDTDWASMSHSIEVRVPLVDWKLWTQVASLTRTSSQAVDKRALAATAGSLLPAAVVERPKTGFVVPTREWMLRSSDGRAPRGLRGWAQHVYEAAA